MAAMLRYAAVAVLAVLALSAASAQQRQRVDVSTLGPQAGQRVPDFRLVDQNGTTRTLESLMGPRGLMLVFLRSADW
jgi:cytochrome oxidase Cu insertion factor (SCO1/SenC/PrrC family)